MIKRIFFSFFIGIVILLVYAPHDEWVKHQLGQLYRTSFEQSGDCLMRCEVESINLLFPSLVFKNVRVSPKDSNDTSWHWTAQKLQTGFSWTHLFGCGGIDMWLDVGHLSIVSEIKDKQLAIVDHFQALMAPPTLSIGIILKSLRMHKATCRLYTTDNETALSIKWNSESRTVGNQFKTRLYLSDGSCTVQERCVFEQAIGNIFIDIPESADTDTVLRMDTRICVPHLDGDNQCFVSGTWRNQHGRFAIANAQDSVRIDPIIITKRNGKRWIDVQARAPLSSCWRFVQNDATVDDVHGTCMARLRGAIDSNSSLRGHIIFDDMHYKDYEWRAALKTSFVREKQLWHGGLQLRIPSVTECAGTWSWNEKDTKGSLFIENMSEIPIPNTPYWHVTPRNFSAHANITNNSLHGSYTCNVNNVVLSDRININGGMRADKNGVAASGVFGNRPFDVLVDYAYPYFKHFSYSTNEDKHYCALQRSEVKETGFSGEISFGLIRSLITSLLDYDVQGEGIAQIHAFMDDHNVIKSRIQLNDTTIRLPQTYNFMHTLRALIDYDPVQRQLCIKNARCGLYAGALTADRIVCTFDKANKLSFVHAPIVLDKCLLNIKKDLFAKVSGHVLLHKKGDAMPALQGKLIIDQAQLKENVLSSALQNRVRSFTGSMFDVKHSDVLCDIGIETRDAIRVDTPFLKANAAMQLGITNSVLNPKIEGLVSILSGSLHFPYASLYISKGTITFAPGTTDPFVDLIAHNKVKNHTITLRVTGSLLDHHIVLESTPPLAEEQIISLLLVGSYDQTLNSMMPALIMQNLRHLIFDANQTSFLERYFLPFDKSFNINLVPSFTDQTGRGGLRGAIEINVNDRWRAMIQKNFSLTEDTRVEIEYLVSDDISVRVIRDERRDVGAEVEMRWKF